MEFVKLVSASMTMSSKYNCDRPNEQVGSQAIMANEYRISHGIIRHEAT